MAFDEAKVDYVLGQVDILSKRFDIILGNIESERAERARLSEVREQRIIRESLDKIDAGIDKLGARLDEKIDLLIDAKTAEQCADIDSIGKHVDEIQIQVDHIDTRTRDFPLVKGRVEQHLANPGLKAIKAWQWILGAIWSAGLVVIPLLIK